MTQKEGSTWTEPQFEEAQRTVWSQGFTALTVTLSAAKTPKAVQILGLLRKVLRTFACNHRNLCFSKEAKAALRGRTIRSHEDGAQLASATIIRSGCSQGRATAQREESFLEVFTTFGILHGGQEMHSPAPFPPTEETRPALSP